MKFNDRAPRLLLIAGLIPALIILIFFRYQEDLLVVMGREVGAFNLARLCAALLSLLAPLFILIPLAAVPATKQKDWRFWLSIFAVPVILMAPSLLAGLIIGGQELGPALVVVLAAGLWLIILALWLSILSRFLVWRSLVIVYGLGWAFSSYLEHLRLYVVAYFESTIMSLVGFVWWFFPQFDSMAHHLDDYLQSGVVNWANFGPSIIQLPVLVIISFMLRARQRKEASTYRGPL